MRRFCISRNMWRAHVSSRQTVVEMYDALVRKGALKDDPEQRTMARACTTLLEYINSAKRNSLSTGGVTQFGDAAAAGFSCALNKGFWRTWHKMLSVAFPNRTTMDVAVQLPEHMGVDWRSGIYIWGSVGIGKTLIMDLFELCETPGLTKRRAHLHAFMSELVLRLHKTEGEAWMEKMGSSRAGAQQEIGHSPMNRVVNEILQESPILCLDEFQTFDVAHAALLAAFFSCALPRGLILFATSNRPPEELTNVSSAFERFVPLLWRYCDVVHCGSFTDHRENASSSHHDIIFLYPNTKENMARLICKLRRGFRGDCVWVEGKTMRLYNRELVVPLHCGGVALFDFSQICGLLGPPDFQCIAKSFHTIVITNVPQISTVSRNAAQQFVILVDELYQYGVKLVFTSAVPWANLFDGATVGAEFVGDVYYSEGEDERSGYSAYFEFRNAEEVLSFQRIASRLKEMGCRHYLLRDHSYFLISDFDLAVLLE